MDVRKQSIRYDEIRQERPDLFYNPPNASYEILHDPSLVALAESAEESRLQALGIPTSRSVTGVVYEDPYLIVLRDAVRRPDGSLGTYVRILFANLSADAAVLPLCGGKIVLLHQFRHATRSWHLEIPRAYGQGNLSTTDLARQEIREEIQADAINLVHLGPFYPHTGIAAEQVELFLAEISGTGASQGMEEISAIEFRTPYQVAQMIRGDEGGHPSTLITDSFTIGAFTRAWLRGLLPGMAPPRGPDNPAGRETCTSC